MQFVIFMVKDQEPYVCNEKFLPPREIHYKIYIFLTLEGKRGVILSGVILSRVN